MVTRGATSFEERVAGVLQEAGFLTAEHLEAARQASLEGGAGLLDTLLSIGAVARETLVTVLSFQLRIPVVDLRNVRVNPEAVGLVPEDFARAHRILPVDFDGDGSLRIATLMPNDFQLASQLSTMTGRQAKLAVALSGDLDELIDRTYATTQVQVQAPPQAPPAPGGGLVAPPAPIEVRPGAGLLGQDISQFPATQAVEMVTLQAVKRRASDIHMVPTVDSSKVLFRVDGALQQAVLVPLTLHETMISRIKVLADMDISEARRPQDGSFSLQFGEKAVDFRVSTIGTTWGEMMVVRILDRSGRILNLEDIGLDTTSLHIWRQLLGLPYGMVMVSGPTGSGKTTTLYASISEIMQEQTNIMTVEDPVEYRMDGLNQIEVNRAAGIDFATGLRAIVRLDPDIILVGEIRDSETAKTAVDAALTGHLVLASIHSNDAASSIVRLLDLGIEPYLAATAVVGGLAQRLVRTTDTHCAVHAELTATESMAYETEMQEVAGQFLMGQGCNFCGGTGFSGRQGVFEVLSVSEGVRQLVAAGASGSELRNQALADGMVPMRRAGMMKAKEGFTTVGEVLGKVFFID